jgi:hypothetical protein
MFFSRYATWRHMAARNKYRPLNKRKASGGSGE